MVQPDTVKFPSGFISRFIKLFVMFFIFVGLGLCVAGIPALMEAYSASEWPSVQGEIVSSRTATVRSSGKTVYEPKIGYRYTVDSTLFTGERVSFRLNPYADSSQAETITARFRPGQIVPVYYNPEAPSNAVLEREFDASLFAMPVVGLVFLIVGLVVYRKIDSALKSLEERINAQLNAAEAADSNRGSAPATIELGAGRRPSGGSVVPRSPVSVGPKTTETRSGFVFGGGLSNAPPAFDTGEIRGSAGGSIVRRALIILAWGVILYSVFMYALENGWF